MTPMPITLVTAAICAIMLVFFSIRVVRGRLRHGVGLGDGGQPDLALRIRVQANFAEYVPLALILLGLLEVSGANNLGLMGLGAALILVRLSHALGLPQVKSRKPHPLRVIGAAGTFSVLLIEAIWGLAIVALEAGAPGY